MSPNSVPVITTISHTELVPDAPDVLQPSKVSLPDVFQIQLILH